MSLFMFGKVNLKTNNRFFQIDGFLKIESPPKVYIMKRRKILEKLYKTRALSEVGYATIILKYS